MLTLTGLAAYATTISIFGVITGIGFVTLPISKEETRSWAAALTGMILTLTLISILERRNILTIEG